MKKPKSSLPPGPLALPLVGNFPAFRRNPLSFLRTLQRRYGRVATIHLGKIPVVCCFRPEHVRAVLIENPRVFTKANDDSGSRLRYLLGEGLLTSDGDFHRQQRRLVQPAFHKKRVESYADVMVRFTGEMLATWQPGSEINMATAMQALTLRIIMKTLFNLDSPEQSEQLGRAFTAVIENAPGFGPQQRFFRSRHKVQKLIEGREALDAFVYGLIDERRKQGQDMGDVLSMLLAAQDEGQGMSNTQVRDQVLTFVAAGHETAQNTLSWTFYLLARHPEIMRELQRELRDVLAGRAPTVEDLARLPYLMAVINESWRVYPPAWTLLRRVAEDFELDGYRLPAGTLVMVSQWVLHSLPDIWGDPRIFRPERWLEEQHLPQGAYFPFGAGSRICIGMPFAQMEAPLLLATILQQYTPRLAPDVVVVPQPRITLRPRYGMRMVLDPIGDPVDQPVPIA